MRRATGRGAQCDDFHGRPGQPRQTGIRPARRTDGHRGGLRFRLTNRRRRGRRRPRDPMQPGATGFSVTGSHLPRRRGVAAGRSDDVLRSAGVARAARGPGDEDRHRPRPPGYRPGTGGRLSGRAPVDRICATVLLRTWRRNHLSDAGLPAVRVLHPLCRREAGSDQAARGSRILVDHRRTRTAAQRPHQTHLPEFSVQPDRRRGQPGADRGTGRIDPGAHAAQRARVFRRSL